MALIVQKYGGSSLATIGHIKRVAKDIIKTQKRGNRVVVVLSAMQGETDRLTELSASVSDDLPPGEAVDSILATGEQISTSLMVIALKELGAPARSFMGMQVPIITDSAFTKARIIDVKKDRVMKTLDKGMIAVVAGFQGVNENKEITTLGRGGSDTTAVAIAAALKADMCEIYTDVDGVYTADPNICPQARHLEKITYNEMLEMAGLGAKVLQIRSVELARKFKVPLLVKSSFGGDRFTWIIKEEETEMEDAIISGVTMDLKEAKISVINIPDEPGIAYKIISPLADASINVDMIIQNASIGGSTDLTFTVPISDLKKAEELVRKTAGDIGAKEVHTDKNITKVSLVGIGVKNHPGVAAKMFQTLADENINIQMISTSEIRISCVIKAKYGELAVRVLHDAFELHKE